MPSVLMMKIIGGVAALLILAGGITAWSHHQYSKGHTAGIAETDKKWQDASDKLKADAAKSATQADDKAVARLEEHVAQANADQAKVDAATQAGKSPLDALFGG